MNSSLFSTFFSIFDIFFTHFEFILHFFSTFMDQSFFFEFYAMLEHFIFDLSHLNITQFDFRTKNMGVHFL